MAFSFLPTIITEAITDLTPELLRQKEIRLLMLDFDNTIVPYTTDVPTEEMSRWLRAMGESDIQLCIVSNSKRDRVPRLCQTYGLECITHARKPFSKGIRRCLDKYGIPAEYADSAAAQIYTDTLGANCAGISSILVTAIDNHNVWLKLRHLAEMPFILAAKNRRLK